MRQFKIIWIPCIVVIALVILIAVWTNIGKSAEDTASSGSEITGEYTEAEDFVPQDESRVLDNGTVEAPLDLFEEDGNASDNNVSEPDPAGNSDQNDPSGGEKNPSKDPGKPGGSQKDENTLPMDPLK